MINYTCKKKEEVIDMSKVLHLNTEEFNEALNSGETLFVDFYADWCGPCKMLAPSI